MMNDTRTPSHTRGKAPRLALGAGAAALAEAGRRH
ncbi:MAG: hypothetical protein JWP65_651 [Ramlibacter sp.]|nr:hypothetical protein [Ramlibacter sp.]